MSRDLKALRRSSAPALEKPRGSVSRLEETAVVETMYGKDAITESLGKALLGKHYVRGFVKNWLEAKAYGFLSVGGEDAVLHLRSLRRVSQLQPRMQVIVKIALDDTKAATAYKAEEVLASIGLVRRTSYSKSFAGDDTNETDSGTDDQSCTAGGGSTTCCRNSDSDDVDGPARGGASCH